MVTFAARSHEPASVEEDAPDFSRYSHPIDRTLAGAENTPRGVTYIPLVMHPSYSPGRRVTKAELTEAHIKQAALRIVAGLELRSLRELAEEIGCSHTAIDNIVHRFCERLGLRPVRVTDATRSKLRAVRREAVQLEHAAPQYRRMLMATQR